MGPRQHGPKACGWICFKWHCLFTIKSLLLPWGVASKHLLEPNPVRSIFWVGGHVNRCSGLASFCPLAKGVVSHPTALGHWWNGGYWSFEKSMNYNLSGGVDRLKWHKKNTQHLICPADANMLFLNEVTCFFSHPNRRIAWISLILKKEKWDERGRVKGGHECDIWQSRRWSCCRAVKQLLKCPNFQQYLISLTFF